VSSESPGSADDKPDAWQDKVQYQGRKASRKGSEQRRQAILDAAMRIIIREGVRAVRHRSVAAEAAVPVSATTYYFKDINDLITDTFAQFVEQSATGLARFWADAEDQLRSIAARRQGDRESRQAMIEQLVELAMRYILNQLQHNRQRLMLEQALRFEALLNPRLGELANIHRQILLRGIDQFCAALGSREPLQDAQMLTAVILRMEYQGLLDGADNLEQPQMRDLLRRCLSLISGL
jgi:DNA-binding transcriptional regulator YbjK